MKKAFTMIELIFVIVVIGILVAVAIPRISSNRDNAKAGICAIEFGNIITEITSNYATLGYTEFQTLTIGAISNVKSGLGVDTGTGIVEDGTVLVISGIHYNCEADEMSEVSFTNVSANGDYNVTIIPSADATTPASISGAALIKKNYKISSSDTSINLPLSY